jgi:hypothetical protein
MVSKIYQWSVHKHRPKDVQPSPSALADLARRRAVADSRDNTGRLLGDPEPGRSALDRKREAEERARLARLVTHQQEQHNEPQD